MFNIRNKSIISILVFIIFVNFNNIFSYELHLINEKSFDVQSGQLLAVKTDVGDITIKTWSKNIVLVRIYGDSDAKESMEFSFDQDEQSVTVIGEKEGGKLFSWFKSIDLKYEVKVPHNFDLDLKSSGGDLVAKNIEGDFNLKTSGGDIYFNKSGGRLNAGTSGGDITLGEFSGDVDISTSGGDIEVNSNDGKIYATTSGGDIYLKASNGEINAKTSGGDITLDFIGKNEGISLVTSGGDIDIKLPNNFNADVEMRTSGGDIVNNFSNNKMSKISKSKLLGKFNNGGNSVVCKTSGGDIQVLER